MPNAHIYDVGQRYQARFGNIDQVCRMPYIYEPAFAQLLEKALDSGRALTRADVEAVFPDVSWDE